MRDRSSRHVTNCPSSLPPSLGRDAAGTAATITIFANDATLSLHRSTCAPCPRANFLVGLGHFCTNNQPNSKLMSLLLLKICKFRLWRNQNGEHKRRKKKSSIWEIGVLSQHGAMACLLPTSSCSSRGPASLLPNR